MGEVLILWPRERDTAQQGQAEEERPYQAHVLPYVHGNQAARGSEGGGRMSEFIIECEYDFDDGWIPGEHREEIVRCRDCKHYEYWTFRDGRIAADCARGGDYLFDTEPNGFCAWGERRQQ